MSNTVLSHLYMAYKNVKLIEYNGGCQTLEGRGKWEDVGHRYTFPVKMSKFWESNIQHSDYSQL